MSKRAAQVQGGKDLVGGFGNEMSANPADPPKRATAAQLASRKIKQARQRTRIASPNPTTSQSFTSPFSTIDPNIVPPSSTGTNGFSFGQSQSFPQTSLGTGAPTPQTSFFGDQNNSGPKLFGSQTGSAPSSFSFSASTSEEIKNPFASMSSGFGQSPGGFQGFQGNTFNIPGTATNQDAQNKPGQPAPTGGIFGASQPQPQTTFSFGGSSTPAGTSLFSAAPPSSTPSSTSAPIFGQSTGSNIFAPSPSVSTNIFGTNSQASKPSDEMQMSPPGKSNGIAENRASQFSVSGISQPSFPSAVTQPTSLFETSAFKPVAPATPSTSQPFSTSIFNTTPSGGGTLFGTLKKPEETTQPTPSIAPATNITHQSPKFSFNSSILAGSSIFGQASKPEEQTAAAAATTATTVSSTPSFSATFSAPSSAPFSLFGTTSKPNEPLPAPPPTTAEDTASSVKSPASEPPTVPGTSLFGHISKPEPPAPPATPQVEAANAPAETSSSPPSVTPSASPFPSTATGGTSLFGQASKSAETSQPTSIFNTSATSATPSAPVFSFIPSSTSIFQTPAKIQSANSSEEKTKEGTESPSSLFQTKTKSDTTPSSTSKPFGSLPQNQNPSIFGSTSASPPPLFKSSTVPEKAPSTPPSALATPPQSFTPTTTPKSFTTGISNGESKITKAMDTSPAKTTSPTKWKEHLIPKSRLSSYGPPAIPRELNNDERAEFDTEWRLNALNNSFKRKVAEADPESNEIDSLIEFYVKVRQHIGAPTGLVVVPKSGRKRKAVEEDGPVAEDFLRNKKAKGLVPSTARRDETDAASFPSSLAEMDGVNSSGEKSASSMFSSAASPLGKRKATGIEGDASSKSESSNDVGNGKRSKYAGETVTGGASPFQKSTNSEKMKYDNGPAGSGSGMNAASDTVTMFATSFVSQSQRGNGPSGFTAPFSTLSSVPASTANTSASSQGSESGNDTESNGSGGEEDGEGEGEEEGERGEESESSPTPPATTNGGRSLFDRVELDQSGKPVREEPPAIEDKVAATSPGEKDPNVSSLFAGSKFASSFNSPTSIGTPQFSNGFDFKSPRSVSPMNPSPGFSDAKSPPSIFASSTGTSTPAVPAVAASTSTSTLFPKASSSLLPNGSSQASPFPFSAGTSADVSRATTPNLSETGADESEEANEDLPQVDLLRGGTGEEDEEEVFETRAKTMKLTVVPSSDDDPNPKPQWKLQGVGLLRILKHKTTGRSRVLVRADPSGRVLLNANLVAAVNYKSAGSAVQFLVPREPKPEQWVVRVKKETVAVELAGVMEKYKK
ncbi:hypothetical protein AJ78_08640 [Emergomyces pasteurianus Ep9510]|uniref:RanBD1 domain-containing protein n=1 Tax=Emergomyces pasteurianus Ep9510 TaxID=1447872 RepID=A0A1J9P0F4_9EURO|nr:hypothetical protein AJ78_08640 [Emergomyces pasteurianus Ep9510]